MNRLLRICTLIAGIAACAQAHARQIVVPGADGSDGALNITANMTIDLQQAPAAAWDAANPNPNMGTGVYDGTQWAVVFRYSSVTIAQGATVRFTNRVCTAPVVWLVSGSVTINGTIILDGQSGSGNPIANPGPGGFASGRAYVSGLDPGSAGFGPGGGNFDWATNHWGAASHATPGGGLSGPTYGGNRIIPLMGGSGGTVLSRGDGSQGGFCQYGCGATLNPGAGGGAMLIACVSSITFGSAGQIYARGGDSTGGCCNSAIRGSGGSGGAIRLVANVVTGPVNTVLMHARGGDNASSGYPGGDGRIRVEANTTPFQFNSAEPEPGFGLPGPTAKLWPDTMAPSIKITSVAGTTVPTDPCGGFTFGTHDVIATSIPMTHVLIETRNVAPTSLVKLRIVRVSGSDTVLNATFQSGSQTLATWNVDVTLPSNFSVLQAIAQTP